MNIPSSSSFPNCFIDGPQSTFDLQSSPLVYGR
ncbi:hypothetical protein LINPERPRIM_LOCUS6619 [Linum perenne]